MMELGHAQFNVGSSYRHTSQATNPLTQNIELGTDPDNSPFHTHPHATKSIYCRAP
eukprot:CAMPEP_0113574558 /NCGR_PEP_ID=MMETSP0015_2-20120614/27211_1 /TAXON_ID=2838 /ORGANISM="Odontella" /LENGTH=55 /DNA_ID=CAMNT_0000477703 /DNA_START=33 /DNA_END=197 /DNA_ORIENTATION=- /assembly_acc=CAM_ASM_000160